MGKKIETIIENCLRGFLYLYYIYNQLEVRCLKRFSRFLYKPIRVGVNNVASYAHLLVNLCTESITDNIIQYSFIYFQFTLSDIDLKYHVLI